MLGADAWQDLLSGSWLALRCRTWLRKVVSSVGVIGAVSLCRDVASMPVDVAVGSIGRHIGLSWCRGGCCHGVN